MMNHLNHIKIEQVVLEKFRLYNRYYLDGNTLLKNEVDVHVVSDHLADRMVVGFHTYIASLQLDEIKVTYPINWYEAFKERWFPAWLLKKYPVIYKNVKLEAKALYPNVIIPRQDRIVVMLKDENYNPSVSNY
jgi:hypothetical protein